MIPANFRDLAQAVRDAVDIVDVAGEITRLQRRGARYLGLCPFHKEKTPSFNVDPTQGLYHCFGCGAGGDAIKLYMEHHGDDFPAAIEALARRYGIPLPAATGGAATPARDLSTVLEAAADFFRQQLQKSGFAQRYLDERRISGELRRKFELGYAPDDWHLLHQTLAQRFALKDLIDAGLAAVSERTGEPYDRFRHRLIFPIHNPSGRLVGFGGRTLGDDRAKYVNTAETEQFHKGRLLYGFHLAKRDLRDRGQALLVEGYFDVLGAAASGIPWTVAGMGTALTPEQATLLARYTSAVTVAYDGDDAGEKAFERALPLLLAAGLGVKRARFPAGHDPDSLRLDTGAEAVVAVVDAAVDGVEVELERLIPPPGEQDPQAKTRAASAIAEILRPIRDDIVRYNYGQRAAERLGIPLDMLWRRVGRTASAPPPAAPGEPRRHPEVRSVEEQALFLLLTAGAALPPHEQLPPPEVFFDPPCRNIYAAFYALYKSGEQRAPAGSDVIAMLSREGDPEGGAIDRMARLLLEDADSGERSLQKALDTLLHRWRRQSQAALMQEIKQAEREGDQIRLTQLLEEKKNLSRSLHPAMTGRLW